MNDKLADALRNTSLKDSIDESIDGISKRIEKKIATGVAVAGLVFITVNGKMEMLTVEVNPVLAATIVGDHPEEAKETLEECIKAAFSDAKSKIESVVQEIIADEHAKFLSFVVNMVVLQTNLQN